jgi:hypothetical protein
MRLGVETELAEEKWTGDGPKPMLGEMHLHEYIARQVTEYLSPDFIRNILHVGHGWGSKLEKNASVISS